MSVMVAAVIRNGVDGSLLPHPKLGHVVTQELTRLVRAETPHAP